MAKYALIDAFERSVAHPDTFDFPGFAIGVQAQPGDLLKIGVEFEDKDASSSGERFWVIVTGVERQDGHALLRGTIDNDLQLTRHHGLSYGDEVAFEARHVLDFRSEDRP